MEEASRPISKLVDQFMDGDIQLPEIQRGFVWTKEKARELVDSIYKGYPSGSILLWETDAPMQTRAAGVGADHAARAPTLLLDGQQRITSLAAVIRGIPVRMKVGGDIKEIPIEVYFNVDHPDRPLGPDSAEDDVGEAEEDDEGDAAAADHHIFRLASKGIENSPHWVSVTDALKKDPGQLLTDNGIDPLDPNRSKYITNLTRLARLKEYKYPVQILGKDTPYSEVTDIFVRVNSQGAKLRKADLALAQVTSRWRGAMDLFTEAADECKQKGFALDEGFMIKCLVSVSTGQSKFNDVSKIDAKKLQRDWDRTKRGLHLAIDFFKKEAGIEASHILPAPSLLVPVACLAVKNGFVFTDELRLKVLKWIYAALIWRRYSRGSTETMLDEDLSSIRDSADPVAEMIERVRMQAGRLEVTAEHLEGKTRQSSIFRMVYILAKKSGAKDWGTGLALGTDPDRDFKALHRQVFAPAAVVSALKGRRGPKEARRLAGDIANTVFHSGRAPAADARDYLEGIDRDMGSDALASQCIPADRSLWAAGRCEEFLARRRDAMADGINGLLASLSSPDGGGRGEDLAVIEKGESDTVEFKASMLYDYKTKTKNRALKDGILKEVVAFMNAKGGTIYVGVSDSKEILGIEKDYKLVGRHAGWDGWSLAFVDAVKTLGPVASACVSHKPVVIAGRTVAKIIVRKGRHQAYLDPGGRGEFVVRMGSESVQLSTKDAAEYMRDRFPEGEGRVAPAAESGGQDPSQNGGDAADRAPAMRAAAHPRSGATQERGTRSVAARSRSVAAGGGAGGRGENGASEPQGSISAPTQTETSAAGDAIGAAWLWYNRQEDKEPFDAAKDDLAGGLPQGLLDPDRAMEVSVQAQARLAKMHSENLDSTMPKFLAGTKCNVPWDAVAYCRSRYADARVSGLLKWHYCLVLHLALGGAEWAARAVPLMLQSADGTANDLRASSYIVSAHNLNEWHGCGLQGAVLASALLFVKQRPHNVFSYKCARIVADLEVDPVVRNEIRDAMIRAAVEAADPDATHCRHAARRLADGRPAPATRTELRRQAGSPLARSTGPENAPARGTALRLAEGRSGANNSRLQGAGMPLPHYGAGHGAAAAVPSSARRGEPS